MPESTLQSGPEGSGNKCRIGKCLKVLFSPDRRGAVTNVGLENA